jgi:CDP-diacylglycerol---serine O-phosphatidyltransferase
MNLRKTFFILPNMFTLASVFCGFFAIATVAAGDRANMSQLYQAAIAIAFGVFFDISDGRVARLTKTQSALGLQLDSLADVLTFGADPALVMYRWGLDQLTASIPHVGRYLGLFICFAFVGCAALRLARFNVLAIKETDEKKKPGKYIIGLPVPAAAAVLMGLVAANYQLGGTLLSVGQGALAVVVVVLSYLMVSRVRFRSFKDLRLSRRTITAVSAVIGAAMIAIFWKRVPSAFVFVTMMAAYLSLGLFEEVIFYRRRRAELLAERARPLIVESDGGARSDEEVLEELGAYDDNNTSTDAPSTTAAAGDAVLAAPKRSAAKY